MGIRNIFLLFISLLVCQFGFSQIDSLNVEKIELKKGFYKNYNEFVTNSPSITLDFETELFRIGKRDTTIVAGKYKLRDPKESVKKIWGFCDGQNVFVKYGSPLGHRFWRTQCRGKNPFFYYKNKTIFQAGPDLGPLVGLAITAAVPASYDVILVTGSGKSKPATRNQIRKLLADDPVLLEKFKIIKVLSGELSAKYIRAYNEKHY